LAADATLASDLPNYYNNGGVKGKVKGRAGRSVAFKWHAAGHTDTSTRPRIASHRTRTHSHMQVGGRTEEPTQSFFISCENYYALL